jgi:hypothetical protein
MVSSKATYEIIDGPSKMELMLALFDKKHGERELTFRIRVAGTAVSGANIDLLITSVEVIDDSGENWNVFAIGNGKRFQLFYRTDTRKGAATIIV